MNQNDIWANLFTKSSFFALSKEEDLSADLKEYQSKILYTSAVETFHPKRKDEFLLGRLCASKAHELCTGRELLSLPANKDRSPDWPTNVVGSISHNQSLVGAAVAHSSDLLGVGIDFEVMGRTKLELAKQIRSPGDINKHPKLSDEELLTLIFSCKETLYKALYPSVKKFFGFEDAALRELDLENGTFKIDLLTELSLKFGPNSHQSFYGRLALQNENCLTCLEIFHSIK